ncbi:uncharacterized protein LOC116304096 [Actinia tenebrosa]|uniref:Uncharacterized protein LOC116304096 n=1 Tax=Actinia tenebrosa TaxID=6105 RepID=A0A6P8IR66_ACTTE|nr:uncharacterized protein LOC116304096 [Actinia tenebrosa]
MAQRKVVLAVDGSPYSDEAFNFYCDNLHKAGDLILVIHAFEMPTMPAAPYPYGFAYYEEWSNLVKKADEEANEMLRVIGEKCKEHSKKDDKYKFELYKEGGRAGEIICNFAKEKGAEFIVLGSRGLGTIRRTFLGSVSDYCVHNAHIPVVVVRSTPKDDAVAEPGKKE